MHSDIPPQAAVTHGADGKFIKHHRETLGITQRQLAAASGYTQSYIAQIESGREAPLETVLLIAGALVDATKQKKAS